MANVYDIYVTPPSDMVSDKSWGTFGSYTELIATANVNGAYHRYINGSSNSSSATLSFADSVFAMPVSDILTVSLNSNVVSLQSYDGRDNVATFAGGGTALLSNGTGWKSFDISDDLKGSQATAPAHINYAFNHTGDSGSSFSSDDGGSPAFIRIHREEIDREEITSAVPEPETYAMLLAGLGLMVAVIRRRKAKHGGFHIA
jgi:hypothetical protein